jgi:ERCC4-related helicase
MAERGDADLFQVLIGQVTENREIDIVLSEALGILGHAELFEPIRDLLHCGPSRSRGAFDPHIDITAERPEVDIHGGLGREERKKAEEGFKHDPQVRVLPATDAAGEGINLQRAHLMVNYDLPWNPNRIEQRFGRIHRIGQTEVCHLWNLVAEETREGDVYRRLLEKLDQARQSLGGRVFDVLGKLHFEGRSLKDLLIEAIRTANCRKCALA